MAWANLAARWELEADLLDWVDYPVDVTATRIFEGSVVGRLVTTNPPKIIVALTDIANIIIVGVALESVPVGAAGITNPTIRVMTKGTVNLRRTSGIAATDIDKFCWLDLNAAGAISPITVALVTNTNQTGILGRIRKVDVARNIVRVDIGLMGTTGVENA